MGTTGHRWTMLQKWPARYYHNSVVFDPDGNGERIWVLGGFDGKDLNDVWSSANGSTWTESIPPGEASKKTDGADANWWKPSLFLWKCGVPEQNLDNGRLFC